MAPSTSIRVLGVECFAGSLEEAAAGVVRRAVDGAGGYACLCSVHGAVLHHHDPELRAALARAWRVFPDGYPVAWLGRRLGARQAERITGTDLMSKVFEVGQASGLRHFLYGSSPEVLELLRARLLERFPRAELVGAISPSFQPLAEDEAREAVAQIRAANPHVVWTGFSTPKQDLWMSRHAAALAPAVVLGVGAAFDFNAGTKERAPHWMQQSGLEWFHRLLSEPRRLAGRYARINSEFAVRAAFELLSRRRRAA